MVTVGNRIDYFSPMGGWGAVATLAALWCNPGPQCYASKKLKVYRSNLGFERCSRVSRVLLSYDKLKNIHS